MKPLTKTIKSGMHLFHENDRSRELYIIQSGSVKVYRTVGSREVELAVLGKGSVLGEMALIDGKPRSASVKVIDECNVVIIDADTFHDKIKGVPAWFLSIVRMTSQKIRQANKRLQNISSEHLGRNIVLTLHYFIQRFDKGKGLDIHKTKHQLIQLLNATQQRILHVFATLQSNGLIGISETCITCPDRQRFSELCTFLRYHNRKYYEKTPILSYNADRFLIAVIEKYPDIGLNPEGTLEIPGEDFWRILSDLQLGDYATLEGLIGCDFLTIIRKDAGFSRESRSLSGTVVKINNGSWYRQFLYNVYNGIVAGL